MTNSDLQMDDEKRAKEADGFFIEREKYEELLKQIEDLKLELNNAQNDLKIISETQGFYSSMKDSPIFRRARRFFQSFQTESQ